MQVATSASVQCVRNMAASAATSLRIDCSVSLVVTCASDCSAAESLISRLDSAPLVCPSKNATSCPNLRRTLSAESRKNDTVLRRSIAGRPAVQRWRRLGLGACTDSADDGQALSAFQRDGREKLTSQRWCERRGRKRCRPAPCLGS
eukprot:762811-Rhodomonas_salina.1